MKINVGDRVSFLNDIGGGTISEIINNDRVVVTDEDGFDHEYPISQLVKEGGEDYDLNTREAEKEISQKVNFEERYKQDEALRKKFKHLEKLKGKDDFWQIDLHIEKLIDSYRHKSNTDILLIQMTRFKHFLERAFDSKVPKLIIIHGVGEGVLKSEILSVLDGHHNIEYNDASYVEYGQGATEARIRYNY